MPLLTMLTLSIYAEGGDGEMGEWIKVSLRMMGDFP